MTTKFFLIVFVVVLSVLLPISCGDSYPWASQSDCDECDTEKPTQSSIIVDISTPEQNVPIYVYKGKYDPIKNSEPISSGTYNYSPVYIQVAVNEYYSVVAEYSKNNKKYTVIDGSELKTYNIESTCGETCWIIKGGTMDCRLKF